jgi:uncharacterized protein (TIGR00106 family)
MLAELSITPLDKGSEGLSEHLSATVELIKADGLSYELTSMGTIVEGPSDRVFALLQKCHDNMVQNSDRVLTTIRIDDHKGRSDQLSRKVSSVEESMKR